MNERVVAWRPALIEGLKIAPPKETLRESAPHTKAKHEILRPYSLRDSRSCALTTAAAVPVPNHFRVIAELGKFHEKFGDPRHIYRLDLLRRTPVPACFMSFEPLLDALREMDLDGIH